MIIYNLIFLYSRMHSVLLKSVLLVFMFICTGNDMLVTDPKLLNTNCQWSAGPVSAFEGPYWSRPGFLNIKLFLTFCQALIIQKSHHCQNLWSAWLTGYQRADYCVSMFLCVCMFACVCTLGPGKSQLCCRPVTGANAGARGCTGLHAPCCDNTERPPKAHKHTHAHSHKHTVA